MVGRDGRSDGIFLCFSFFVGKHFEGPSFFGYPIGFLDVGSVSGSLVFN